MGRNPPQFSFTTLGPSGEGRSPALQGSIVPPASDDRQGQPAMPMRERSCRDHREGLPIAAIGNVRAVNLATRLEYPAWTPQRPNRRRVLDRSRVTMAAPRRGRSDGFLRGPRAVRTAHERTSSIVTTSMSTNPWRFWAWPLRSGPAPCGLQGRVEDRRLLDLDGAWARSVSRVGGVSQRGDPQAPRRRRGGAPRAAGVR